MTRQRQALVIRVALVVGVLVLLEVLCRTGIIGRITMVPPSQMFMAAASAFSDAQLRAAMLLTLTEVVTAAVLAVVAGGLVGLGLFLVPWLRRLADPVLSAWYAVPIFIFYPVMIVLFGIGERPIIAIAFVFSIAAMILSTLTALDRIPRALFKTARIHRLGPVRRTVFILLPAALPHLVVGLRLVLAYAFIAAIAGEFILSSAGIGHSIAFAYDDFETPKMYGLILIVIAAAVVLNGVLSALARRFGVDSVTVKGATGG